MSSIPTKVKIAHLTYNIRLVKDLKDEEGHTLYGEHSPFNLTMSLNAAIQNKSERCKEVLLHECLHAIMDLYHKGPVDEESVVDAMGVGIINLLVDNPKLGKYLCSN